MGWQYQINYSDRQDPRDFLDEARSRTSLSYADLLRLMTEFCTQQAVVQQWLPAMSGYVRSGK